MVSGPAAVAIVATPRETDFVIIVSFVADMFVSFVAEDDAWI
jgi:hypothetical protein